MLNPCSQCFRIWKPERRWVWQTRCPSESWGQPTRSKRGNICGGKKPVDTQALRKKVSSVTCGPAARAILSSLLLYITDLQDRPPELPPARTAAGGKSRAGCSPGSQNGQQRPTCFQLLQAKFMGTGREPRLKKPRDVGRLISKDKQGPGRSLVTATISKLLEKAREGASRAPQDREPPHSQKPRQGLPAGKGTVKNILKMFLAAEEKEVREEPRAARAPLPKLATKRGSVLSKLREKFEQSGCLCSEAKVLPLRTEGRKKNLQRRRTHLPESHVFRTTAMASTCIRTPLARFLACTAEPVLAFSIATVICGPGSWLSHCAKISHSQQGRVPSMGGMAPRGVRTARQGQPGAGPAQPPASWATAPADSPETGFLGGGPPPIPGPAPSPASHSSGALPGSEPLVSLLKPASPGHAGAVRGDRTGDPPTGDTAQHTGAPGEARMGLWPGLPGAGAGMAPEVALTVCSSEDETEGVTLDLEGDPLFAVQETFPEQKVAGHVLPLLLSTVQALRCTQSAVGSPQVTVTRPDTRQMSPPPATLPKAVGSPQVTVAQPDTRQMSPPPATLPKAVGSPQVTVARPHTRQMSPPPATLPKAVGSPQVTVARPHTRQMSPPPATLPKAVGSPQVTVARPHTRQMSPPPAMLPKAVGSPQVTVARPDTRQMSPPPATLPKAVGSPQVTVARPHTRQMSPPPATLPKAVGSPQVTVARPDTRQMSPPPATLPKAVGSPQVTVARPDTRQMSPPPATLPKASGGGDKSSSLLSSGGRGGGGLESARVPFPTGTHSESIRAAGTVGGSLRALSVPSARASTSVGQDFPAAAPQRCPTWGKANGHSFGDSKERQRPEGPAGEDVPEQACEKHQWPASGDRPVRGGDAPWHHPTVSENRGRGDSPSVPGHQQALPADVGHPVGVSAALEAATPRDRTPSDSPTSAGEQVLCERELRGPPLRSPARPSLRAAGSPSPGLGSDRPTSLSKHPKPTPEAPRRVAATGATESRNAPAAGNVPNPVNSAAREQHPVHEGESHPLPTHRSLAAPALIRAASPPPVSVPPGPWRPLLGAAQSGACGGSGQRRPETPQALATVPLEAGPRTSAVAESEASAGVGGRRAAAAAGSPWGGDTTPAPGGAHLTPQGRAAVGPLPSPPENQQTEEDKHVPPKDQVPPGAGAPRQPPSPGAAAGGQRVGGEPHKSPDPQAHGPPVSLTRNGAREGVEVGDRRQLRAGLGAPEEEAAGPMGLDGPPEKGVALWGQKPGSCAAKEGQTRPGEVEGGRAAEVGTGHQGSEKGSEHAQGQRVRRAENPPRGHGAQAGKNQAPSPAKKPGRPAQVQAGRMAPHISVGPPDSSSEAVPTAGASGRSQGPAPRGSQAEPGTPHQGGESQPTVGGSQRSSGPEPVPGSTVPAPKPAGRETPWAPAQEGPPKTLEAGSGASERERRRRLAHFAKYRAQSFGDQRSFDLSFRPTIIRANDTFELPK
ncbi:collagen alpha-1(I) chain isoform X2 [Zalophus californianus]|uniref:Collagen alpha-1(I) chain isoform X2 n=1 Tax=Zalophus californianus TaxID=9704 RepID=A0A6P9FKG3_ZALCA|nr:collagen alpha-1(I) chain isoform X2 [Zalophus californianus]